MVFRQLDDGILELTSGAAPVVERVIHGAHGAEHSGAAGDLAQGERNADNVVSAGPVGDEPAARMGAQAAAHAGRRDSGNDVDNREVDVERVDGVQHQRSVVTGSIEGRSGAQDGLRAESIALPDVRVVVGLLQHVGAAPDPHEPAGAHEGVELHRIDPQPGGIRR